MLEEDIVKYFQNLFKTPNMFTYLKYYSVIKKNRHFRDERKENDQFNKSMTICGVLKDRERT